MPQMQNARTWGCNYRLKALHPVIVACDSVPNLLGCFPETLHV
jgi:hypothetical protein